jgi:hypothetical protein
VSIRLDPDRISPLIQFPLHILMRPVIATRTKGASLAKRRKKAGLNHKICAENADNVNNT